MNLLIIPDIFGATPALTRLARDLEASLAARTSPKTVYTDILNPYGKGIWFEDEAAAYKHFTGHLGIPAYAGLIGRHLDSVPGPSMLLAFSAGASAVWHLAGTAPCPQILGAVGFYGSQIRNDAGLAPCFDIHLIFPESESHFSVDDLIAGLGSTPGTSCEKTAGRHGFMNRFSLNFDEALYTAFIHTHLPARLAPVITQGRSR